MNPIKGIVNFNVERNLHIFDIIAEYKMLEEELQELMYAGSSEDINEIIDALCDLVVLAVGGIHKLGYDPTIALQETVKEITSRKGAINEETGKWQKDPNQDISTLYKADYNTAKL